MPPVALAAIPAIAGIGGALIQSGAAKNAQKQQGRANQQALQYQREKDMEARRQNDRAWADYERRSAAREQTRRAIAKKYGIDLGPAAAGINPNISNPGGGPQVPPGGPTGAPAARPGLTPGNPLPGAPSFTGQPAAPPMRNPVTQGSPQGAALMERAGLVPQATPGAPMAPEGAPGPSATGNWNDWSRYGLR